MWRESLYVASLVVIGILNASLRADDGVYKIVLNHPTEVGRMFSVSGTTTTSTQGEAKQKEFKSLQTKKYAFDIEATEKVLAVEPNTKMPCKVELTIKKLTSDGDPLAPADSVIVVENLGPAFECTMAGQPVEAAVSGAIRRTLPLHGANDPHSADEISGTSKPEQVGDHWNQDSAQLAHFHSTPDFPISENDVNGTGTLISADSTDHGLFLRLAFHIEWRNQHEKLSDGWHSKGGTVVEDGTRMIAEDPNDSTTQVEWNRTFTDQATWTSPDGRTGDYQLISKTSSRVAITPINNP